jgi:hypothetical protein
MVDPRVVDNYAIRSAAENGHIEIVEEIIRRFKSKSKCI